MRTSPCFHERISAHNRARNSGCSRSIAVRGPCRSMVLPAMASDDATRNWMQVSSSYCSGSGVIAACGPGNAAKGPTRTTSAPAAAAGVIATTITSGTTRRARLASTLRQAGLSGSTGGRRG